MNLLGHIAWDTRAIFRRLFYLVTGIQLGWHMTIIEEVPFEESEGAIMVDVLPADVRDLQEELSKKEVVTPDDVLTLLKQVMRINPSIVDHCINDVSYCIQFATTREDKMHIRGEIYRSNSGLCYFHVYRSFGEHFAERFTSTMSWANDGKFDISDKVLVAVQELPRARDIGRSYYMENFIEAPWKYGVED